MKKIKASIIASGLSILMIFILAFGISGCGGKSGNVGKDIAAAQTGSSQPDTASKSAPPSNSTGVSLDELKKAAKAAGYNVTDDHQGGFLKDVKAGFSVQFVADGKDTKYSIVECTNEEAAINNAKEIDSAGRNIAIRTGKILTFYSAENKNGTSKDILASILSGKPMAKK